MKMLIHHPCGLLLTAFALVFLSGCEQKPQLERIQQTGTLIVATRIAPTTYYPGANGPEGIEYELTSRFADYLGVTPRFVFPEDLQTLLHETRDGEVHMAAAGLTITPQRQHFLRFSDSYQDVFEQLVYRRGTYKPRSIGDIKQGQLHVVGNSSHVETLQALTEEFPGLSWIDRFGVSQNRLLNQVNAGAINFTVSDSHELAWAQRMYPYLAAAHTFEQPQALAWAFPAGSDGSLRAAANQFLQQIREDGTLKLLLERYYGHTERMNFVDRRDFRRHMRERLPKYQDDFYRAAEITGYDWRLLAAIGYQESHWQANAVSPTGVRGIMMLTRATAKRVGVKKRTDPTQSIHGGAKYLKIVERKIPERIQAPDRIWFALAGYNIGFGHLEDARILTERAGDNPDLWMDVKNYLPLLREKKYYKTVRYGFARGEEPVNYVENIRNYFDLLVWYENHPEELGEP